MRPITLGVLALWFVVVFLLGAAGAIARPPGTPPFPILISATAPVIVFLGAYCGWPAFRAYVLSLDLPLATAMQAWRGRARGHRHRGDRPVGRPPLVRRPGFAISRVFVVWNLLGILDLVVAVSVGGLSSALASGAPGEVTTGPMAQLPLVLIPAYLVPLFVILHLAALFQARRQASSMV